MKKIGLYIHIPFCASKCFYCDFYSFVPAAGDFEAYAEALINEINSTDLNGYKIDTIFFGGGTPSYMPPFLLAKIYSALRRFDILPGAEITMEVNPGTLDMEKLDAFLNFGVNRLSIGCQSTDDKLIKLIGRRHTTAGFYDCYNNARAAGFNNINIDIMFNLPGQTTDIFLKTCEDVAALNPEHISAYALTVEDKTPLKKMADENLLTLPGEDAERAMYYLLKNHLKSNGYVHYEISNFAKSGYACRHNVSCWTRGEYLGFGPGACSYIDNRRFNNTKDFGAYIKADGDIKKLRENILFIDAKEALEETMFLGLRMLQGVAMTDEIYKAYHNKIATLTASGLLQLNGGDLCLTDKGLDYANIVFTEFLQ